MIFTKEENARIQDVVLNTELARLSEKETIEFVKEQTGFTLTHNQVMHRRRLLKQKRIALMQTLRVHKYAYKLVFLKRIEEIERSMEIAQKDMLLFTSITDPAEQRRVFFYKQKLTYQIIELNKQLVDLYLLLPMVDSAILKNGPLDSQATYQQLPESAEAAGDLSQAKF